jgi:hypothetical protein
MIVIIVNLMQDCTALHSVTVGYLVMGTVIMKVITV